MMCDCNGYITHLLSNRNHKAKLAPLIIYSTVKEIVEHQQYMSEILWNKSMSAKRRIFFAPNETKQMGEKKQSIWM